MSRTRHFLAALCIVIIGGHLLPACRAQTEPMAVAGSPMISVNLLYESGAFAEAASGYEALVDAGVHDGHLYYNLGDAYFKMGDLGRAVLNFRRAQRLLPRDGDVAANLKLARAQTRVSMETPDQGPVANLVHRITNWVTLNEAAIVALVLWIFSCGLVIAAIAWRQRRRVLLYASFGPAILLVFALSCVGLKLLDDMDASSAVVVATEAAVHSGPGDSYLIEFILYAGAEVRVIEQREEWLRIALSGDLQGWVPHNAVIELFPPD